MIQKARGIVLHHLNYGDTSMIVHLYTDLYGRVSVMIKGARAQKKNRRISLYHPLALLEVELHYKENRDLQQIREARPIVPLYGIMGDPVKNTIALFLAEVFYRSIRENEANPGLFDYLIHSVQYFDLMEEGTQLYHLHILVHLTRFLGFRPNVPEQPGDYWFDMETGSFLTGRPIRENRFDPELSAVFIDLLKSKPDQLGALKIPRSLRNELIEKLLHYYALHLHGMGQVKSFGILKEVFG